MEQRYIVQFMDGSIVEISESDFKNLAGRTGLVIIASIKEAINLSSVKWIGPKQVYETDMRVENRNRNEGILHDGTRVIRQFGTWYITGETDEGGLLTRRIDPAYYPEVARDCVPSPHEYHAKYAQLPREERLRLMMGERETYKSKALEMLGGGLKKIE